MEETFASLSELTATPAKTPAITPSAPHIEAIIQILDRWPSSQCFPVIDLSRLLTGFCPTAFDTPELTQRFLDALLKAAEWSAPWSPPLTKARETNILLLLRTLSNMFQENVSFGGACIAKVFEALDTASYTALNKAQRVALATLLVNISCFSLRSPLQKPLLDLHITFLLKLLHLETADSEAVYRALVGLGNTVYAIKNNNIQLDSAQRSEIQKCLGAISTTFPEDRVKGVAQEIKALL